MERIGSVAYRLELSTHLDKIHNVFRVSLLWKAKIDPSRVLPQVPMKIKGDLIMEAKLVKILDRDEKVLRNKRVPLVRVLWRSSWIKGRNMGKRIRDKGEVSASIHRCRYVTWILRMKFLFGGENVNPRKINVCIKCKLKNGK
jgi:hypothetical protein